MLRNKQYHLQGVTEKVWFGWSYHRISFRVGLECPNYGYIVAVAISFTPVAILWLTYGKFSIFDCQIFSSNSRSVLKSNLPRLETWRAIKNQGSITVISRPGCSLVDFFRFNLFLIVIMDNLCELHKFELQDKEINAEIITVKCATFVNAQSKAWKNSGLTGFEPLPLRYRCSALTISNPGKPEIFQAFFSQVHKLLWWFSQDILFSYCFS